MLVAVILINVILVLNNSSAGETEKKPPPVEPCGRVPDGMACIKGGSFIRGHDSGPANARPRAEVWLQTFFMDLNEVTYAEYKQCEKQGKCPAAEPQYMDFNNPEHRTG